MEKGFDVSELDHDNCSNDFDFNEDLSIHHKVPLILQNKDWDELTDMICQMDSGPMNQEEREIAQRIKQSLLSARDKLKRNKIILRASYKGDTFHMFKQKDFQQNVSNYMKQMGIYSHIHKLEGYKSETITQKCLLNIVDQVETTLYDLFRSKHLTKFQYNCMDINRAQVQLNYLYFVPETDKVNISYFIFDSDFLLLLLFFSSVFFINLATTTTITTL